jgi:iron complex outermembrane receptor protein
VFSFAVLLSFSYAQKGTVAGIVLGSEGALPLATVSLANYTVLTNKQGEFLFSINPGNYSFAVTHSGYTKLMQQITVEAGHKTIFQCTLTPDEQLGEVILLGSRSTAKQGNLNTPVPVDVLSSGQLSQTGQVSLTQMLHFTAPSFNASRELLNEPVTLRGLDPQHVLILLNGTRYHNLAWYYGGNLKGHLGHGSVGNDLNSVPFSAIEKVEILRDGAAAQYGSDAIAGVINIRLKETTGKTFVRLHTGQFYKDDGEKFSFGINRGFSLHKKGFVNFSGDFGYQEPAYRGGIYQGTVYTPYPSNATHNDSIRIKATDDSIIHARGFDRKSVLDNAGTLKILRTAVLMNGSYASGNRTKLFWTAAINNRKVWRDAVYRFPKNPSQVNLDLFPNGFQAKNQTNNIDVSTIAGIKSETKNQIRWEVISSYGQNALRLSASNSNNPSQSFMGKNAPTTFNTGKQIYEQLTNNINFSKAWRPVHDRSLNIAVGGEWRVENYRTVQGDSASWNHYDPTGNKQGGAGGISPQNEINRSRNVFGTYFDAETELNNRFLVDAAARYEYYSDMGSNIAGKLAVRYKLSNRFMLRASVNNGFRAPSLQQRYSISTSIVIDRATGRTLFSGLYPNDHEVARALGIPKLTAERTMNISSGMTVQLNNQNSLTMDAYWIQIRSRVVLSGSYNRTSKSIDSILRPHTNLSDINQISFFSNAINTRTFGIDLVFNGFYIFSESNLHYTLAANLNRTNLFGKIQTPRNIPTNDTHNNILLNRADKASIEEGQPQDKILLNLNYQKGKLGFILNNTRFGRTVNFNSTSPAFDESYSPKILTDVSINYKARSWVTITAGANNVFNVYPDKINHYENSAQGIYIYNPEATPFGFYGGYYFVAISFEW